MILLMLLLCTNAIFANETSNFTLIKDINNTKVYEAEQVLYGKAPASTQINLKLYSEKSQAQKSLVEITSSNEKAVEKKEVKWQLEEELSWTIGASEVFANTIKLKMGRNKLVMEILYADGKIETKEYGMELLNKKDVMEQFNNLVLSSKMK